MKTDKKHLRPLTIAIDYDATWTAAPDLWREIAHLFLNAGHRVVMVTQRSGDQGERVHRDVNPLKPDSFIPVVFAGGMTKVDGAREAGYEVDIWCDDWPPSIMQQKLTYIGDGNEAARDREECDHPVETLATHEGSAVCFRCRKTWHTEDGTEEQMEVLLDLIRQGEA